MMTKLDDRIAQHRKELERRPPGDTGRGKALFNLVESLDDKLFETNDIEDLDGTIGLRTALALRSAGHPDRHSSLYWLAWCLQKRYRKQGTLSDLEEAITLGIAALELLPECHPDRSNSLHHLALCFSDRYDKQTLVADLEEAITLGRAALKLRPPGHIHRAATLHNLGFYLRRRFLKLGATRDLDEALSLHQLALDLHPEEHPKRSDLLHNLALCFSDRYDKQGSVADLEEAITLGRAALKLRPPGHSDRASTVYNLGNGLRRRFMKLSATADLDEALSLHRSALDLLPEGHPDRSNSLHFLAVCFSDQYDKQGSVADLEEAITLCRAMLKLRPPGHSDIASTPYSLGLHLRDRFLKFGAVADLDEAILHHRSALDLRPEGDPQRSHSLHSLATCFSDRYDKKGSIADLEEAITLGRAALELRSRGHANGASTLYNLGNDLRRRFLKLGATADLDEALSLHRSALDLRPEGHHDRSGSLHYLALCLSDRYDKHGSVADLEEAIALGRAALELHLPGHFDRASTFYNLGNDLRRRFLKLGATADLDEAISHHRSALKLRPADHLDRLLSLNELVSCLGLRFKKLEAPTDLDDLVALNRAILDLHPPGHDGYVKSIDKLLLHLRKRRDSLGTTSDLDECITLGRIALGLRKPGDPGHATCYRPLVDDLQSMLRKLEGASDVLDSSVHTKFLHNLVICVGSMVSEGHVFTGVDETVTVARAALKLCPPGHSVRIASLTTLTTCLQHRFQKCDDTTDLDEAITLCKEILKRCPSGSPDSAPPLHKLAWCLSQKFIKLSTRSDLEDAIKFEQAASTLYPSGHPDRAECFDSLSNYLHMGIKGRNANPPPARSISPNDSLQVKQLIRDVVFEVLKVSPPRLLYTRNGTLCDLNSQITHFENSHEFNQLMSSVSTLDNSPPVTRIHAVVSTYFRYVTLSHRWGDSEPLLRNIEGQVIYDLDPTDGLSKLQCFCLASCRHGYLWAWSDTCCIDKESSAELQEAIGSMFSWYRQSALTIVHLADVSETGTLISSVWFKRGWTLQELLAPRSLLFFTRDWLLYRGISSNHKEDSTILGELEQATGIKSRHLTNFYPSADEARSRLQWASTRFTTRPEDISYSLFGVFGLHIPVLYGESTGNALGRLLAEVISKSGDTSILDWVGQSSAFHSCFPATIAPYQTLPSQRLLLDPATSPNLGWSRFLTLRAVRKMHPALSRLPLTQFINFRLILPCIVHHINNIELTRVETAVHVHRIEAIGLEPIEITLSQPLENTSGTEVVTYILIRPWHSSFLDTSDMTDNTSARRWLMRMQRPFSALLLQELPRNEYRRVASSCHIPACPTNSTGILKGEVTTLTIV